MTLCNVCDDLATVRAFAAWPTSDVEVGRYPAPMIRSCSEHLAESMMFDQSTPGHTPGYYVEVI